jgi:hypothetical protein|tara:strand:- start:812 stop:1144 length:333 start_codon:yes stop_codon:yes gene_type:complete
MKLIYIIPFIMTTYVSAECMADYKQENFDTYNWSKASACLAKERKVKRDLELASLREFLKENPRYRFPGQSLNKCFGKARENHITSVEYKPDSTVFYFKKQINTCLDVEN